MSFTASVEPGSEFSYVESSWVSLLQLLLDLAVVASTNLDAVARFLDSVFSSQGDLELAANVYPAYAVKLPNIFQVEAPVHSKAAAKESTKRAIPLL
jgi:hypothetical protein